MTPSKQRGAAPNEDDSTQVTVGRLDSEEFTAETVPPSPPQGRAGSDLAPGTTLGEYTIEGKIGEGGMGAVFTAVHPLIGKRAAVKVLKKELCEDPITLERFIDEARVVNQIGNPNIVDVFAFGTLPDGRSYFVMEWLKGESLRDRVARGPLHPIEASAILKTLAHALEAAHDKGVVHRDLKPDNVFLLDDRADVPRVKLLDFGIAKLVRAEDSVSRTATGAMIGTPQYVAPEQARGHAIDARVDIYSLGCVAFELLAGRPPFVADNAMEMVAKHLMEEPPRLSTMAPGLPRELEQLVMEMLAKDREMRPTITEICAVLDAVQRTPTPRSSEPALARFGVASMSVTRQLGVNNPDVEEDAPPPRSALWARLGLVAGGIAMGAVAFMIVSSLRAAKPNDVAHEVTAPPPAPAAPTSPDVAPAPAPDPVAPAPAPAPAPVAPAPVAPAPVAPAPASPRAVEIEVAPAHRAPPAPEPRPHVVRPKTPPAPAVHKPDPAAQPAIKVPDKNNGLMKIPDENNGLMRTP